ncbi:response regulator transcription factor [Streptomyces sp. 4F14]|uniref:response regulator transcription factor n=1 Tax=Streptomyces sp. 4F14 TaxID=3394380 RepID=UPI003A854075
MTPDSVHRIAVAHAPFDPLSPREQEILLHVAHGLSDCEISRVLSISPRTVSAHMCNIREKLDARNRTHLVAQALRAGLLVVRTDRTCPEVCGSDDETFLLPSSAECPLAEAS